MCVCVDSCYITLITHTSFTFLFNRWNETHKKATTGAHPVYVYVYIVYLYTMKHNNKITSWKIYLVKKMTHIRSDIIMHAYNFRLLLFSFFFLSYGDVDVDCWLVWKDIYVRLCACFFFLHKNGVKWYMTGRMFWIYCDYYIFLSFGYYYLVVVFSLSGEK